MAEVFGFETGVDLPTLTGGFGWGTITLIITILLFIISFGIILWILIQWRTYKYKIILFENIGGQGYQPTFKDRARILKIGNGGEELLWLKKKKVYRTAYGKKMGKNTYWFAVGQDGYWYNVLLGDLDAKMGMLDIEPVDRDMRYMHVAIRKNITERYRKIGIMEKYGPMIINGIFLLIMIIGLWLLIDQIGELMGSATSVVDSMGPLIEQLKNVAGKIDTICSGGSGIS